MAIVRLDTMNFFIYTLTLLVVLASSSSCSTMQKLNKKSKKEIDTQIFSYETANIKTLSCVVTSNLTAKAASIGRVAHILSPTEIAALMKLKINAQLSSESTDNVMLTFPELKPFENPTAKTKLGPFIDASVKIIEADFLVINTLLALPVLDERTADHLLSETKDYYVFKASSKNYKSITIYKDKSKIILDPVDSKEGLRTTVNSSKAANADYFLIRTSLGTNPDKDIQYSYIFTYEYQNNVPVPSSVKVNKKDFDIVLDYVYTFKECTPQN